MSNNEQVFLICEECGNIVGMIHDAGIPMVCCGVPMKKLEANTVDASLESHVPVVKVEGNRVEVKVGSRPHPMLPEHWIQWIYVQTENGGQRKALTPGQEPKASFLLEDDKAIAVYAYCNLHGLWKTDVK